MSTTSILILNSHLLFGEALSAIYKNEQDFEVVGVTSETSEALQLASAVKPTIILIGVHIPVPDALHLTRELFSVSVQSGLIMLGWTPYHDHVLQFLQAGARGYLSMTSTPEELIRSTKIVRDGGIFVTDEIENSKHVYRMKLTSLSSTEMDIVRLTQKGLSNFEIAKAFAVSEKTIEMQQYQILQKLGLRNTKDLLYFINSQVFCN